MGNISRIIALPQICFLKQIVKVVIVSKKFDRFFFANVVERNNRESNFEK